VADPADTALTPLPASIRGLVRRYAAHGDPLTWTVRQIPGGFRAILRLLELSSDPEAAQFVEAYRRTRQTGPDKGTVSVAEILQEAQMAPRDFVGLVSRVAFDFNIALGRTIAAVNYPKMMKASVKRAQEAEATDERKLHFQATGYLPTSKGIQIGIANNHLALPDDRPPAPGRPASFDRTARQVVRDLPGE